ncbi:MULTISPECIES: CAP domain-containing protein [Streptomyces]|uniref:CAP domain-containing protein n=1 Tax=Streptomyces dengpaensis TaxID=2049881 RepID=A0ABM6SJU2_9ACTN|nr:MULTISPECIES: CAP domain-containing protein [Streptomyces]AVH54852.1 CAP domain-containing protein [Streptomyces dengpaensis]PIB03297.1 hypothetical protein B1C81_37595 [Streptomyces sp. HG99]
MNKHRRKTRHRQITIAALALSALAIPSAAMACMNDPAAANAATPPGPWQNASLNQPGTAGEQPLPPMPTAPPAQDATTPASNAPAAPTASPSSPDAEAPASGAADRIVTLVNSERSKAGCSPVTLNEKLSKAAQDHSADMASHQNMSHTGSDGSDPGTRITRAGYSWSTYGENVAYGYSSPEQVMAGWMSSPGHKKNILNCGFKEIGVGLAQPGNYWTQDFGTAR